MQLATTNFEMTPYTGADKEITIIGGDGEVDVRVWVDHDDCDHDAAEELANAIVGLPGMVKALQDAEATFRRYAEGHQAKADDAAHQNHEASLAYKAKAEANLAEADRIRDALKAAGVA